MSVYPTDKLETLKQLTSQLKQKYPPLLYIYAI